MGVKIYFLRHGETIYSRTDSYCGETDAELTPEGEQMAVAFAEAYHPLPWLAVYASPMRRTIATAQPLCDAIQMEMQLHQGLKEIFYGEWETKNAQIVQQTYPDDYTRWVTEPAWHAPTGGETSLQIANRALPVIAEIEATYSEGNVLVVSHKATIRIILCSLLGIDLGRYRDRLDMPAGSISVVAFEKYGPRLERLGDRSYMPAHLHHLSGS